MQIHSDKEDEFQGWREKEQEHILRNKAINQDVFLSTFIISSNGS